ncbi:MAG: dTMP kinase [Syntrophus sp. (in: bacteria)]|nr:dTMP kinase [Syntrophus sp. (in: bacteria)]
MSMLITFEGIEGCGKSTQVEILYEYLLSKGYGVIRTREPGGTMFGEVLRNALLQGDMNVSPLPELLVFMAMRAQHIEEVIMPALQDRKIVLCDRFTDATYAYQGYGRGIDLGIIENLNRLVTKGVRPHCTILLDVTVEVGLKRKARHATMDRIEKEALSFHEKIKKAYEKLSQDDPGRFFIIDGNSSPESIGDVIRERVITLMKDYGI